MIKIFKESQQDRHRNRNPINPICSLAAGEGNGGGEMVHSNVEKKTVAPETKKTQYKYNPGSFFKMDHEDLSLSLPERTYRNNFECYVIQCKYASQ